MSNYAHRSAELQELILVERYYPDVYRAALEKLELTEGGVRDQEYAPKLLNRLWEEFWWKLPDSPAIRRSQLFFKVCDLCEEFIEADGEVS